ncbi:MAG TPA: sensor histidine kinase [Coriobacteriia bacterium]
MREPEPGFRAALDVFERERLRLAFDLHDGPAQDIAAALLQVRLLRDFEPEERVDGLQDLQEMLATALEDMYLVIEQLHCRGFDSDGLAAQVGSQVEAFTSRSGVPVALSIEGAGDGYSQSLRIAVCRVVQEALTNAWKHSGAKSVSVRVSLGDDRVEALIEDEGLGFDVSAVEPGAGARGRFGLEGMRQRAALLGGDCVIESTPGRGTRVRLSIPVWRS